MNTTVTLYKYGEKASKSNMFKVYADSNEVFVYETRTSAYATFSCDGKVQIKVHASLHFGEVSISPKFYNKPFERDGENISFEMTAGEKVVVNIEGVESLFISANREERRPPKDEASVKYFKAGEVYEVGEVWLEDGQTLYLEGGAVLKGSIRSDGANNIRIEGPGIIDGNYYRERKTRRKTVLLSNAKSVRVSEIAIVNTTAWTLEFLGCEDVTVSGITIVSDGNGSDGIDIVSSSRVIVENSLIRSGDDCVVIKSINSQEDRDTGKKYETKCGVKDIRIKNCILLNSGAGNALEIGHELKGGERVGDIIFENCDILGVHGQGSAFSINDADSGFVEHVKFVNIRVEHYYNKLVSFRVMKGRYSKEEERGYIKDILLQDIFVTNSEFNPGYSVSVIGGYDEEHLAENIRFKNFRINGKPIESVDEIDLHTRYSKDITVEK